MNRAIGFFAYAILVVAALALGRFIYRKKSDRGLSERSARRCCPFRPWSSCGPG